MKYQKTSRDQYSAWQLERLEKALDAAQKSMESKGCEEVNLDPGFLCENYIGGGDCYGENLCKGFTCDPPHHMYKCECGYGWCGCCFERGIEFNFCPRCNTVPVKTTIKMYDVYW